MGSVIVLYILSIVHLIKCGYPPTGDEVIPGSVLLPASRRGRYLANIVRRQAVDGTGIKFNKDADRMNAEAKKKVDVLSEELLPYIIAEQERRTTLHKRVMTAIQNGEKGVTIAEMRNKPPLIIRKGLMYRCPANRAPKEPDGSGLLMCEDEIAPTQVMYDACLSAEDKELYNAENKYFFCNRHKIEGPDLPRNGTTVYGCAPIERTSFNYTTTKCSLEDTEDVVVHYRYYPDRTYKYVTELDPDREVCDHWNPCQIGYIFSLPSPDMATPASELWPDAPDAFDDYEKDEIVPPIPEDSIIEYLHSSTVAYTSSPRTITMPHTRRTLSFHLDKIQVRNGKGKSRKINPKDYSVKTTTFSITITLSFEEFSPKYFGTFYAMININDKPTPMKFLTLMASNIEVTSQSVDCLHGQRLNISAISVTCDGCRVHGLMVRARDNNVYNIPSSRFRVRQSPNRLLNIDVNVKDPQPQDFGDYFAIIENNRGQEERHKVLTVRAPENDVENLITLNRFDVACNVQGNYNNITKYECKECQLTDILCNGQSVLAAGRVTIIPQSQQISYNFPSFADSFSCVYMGFFKVKDSVYKKVVAIIENNSPTVKISEVVKVTAPKEDDSLDQEIMFEADSESCDVKEIIVNGINLEQSARRSNTGIQAMFQVTQNTINIHIGPFLEAYAGMYQARFQCGDDTITKNIMEVKLPDQDSGHNGDDSGKKKDSDSSKTDDDTKKGGGAGVKLDLYTAACEVGKDCPAGEKTYECEECTLKVKCNDADVDAAKVTVDAAGKKVTYALKAFADTDSCVYMGEFDVKGEKHNQPIAVVENASPDLKITEVLKKTAKAGEALPESVVAFTTEKTAEVEEIRANGHVVDKANYEVDAAAKTIKFNIPKMTAEFAGHYQAKIKLGEEVVTKNIMEVTLEGTGPTPYKGKTDDGDHKPDDGDHKPGPPGSLGVKISAVPVTSCKVDHDCTVEENTYECEGCTVKVKCNDADVDAAKVVVDAAAKKFTYAIKAFTDKDSCVYMGDFEAKGKSERIPIAVIENESEEIKVTEVLKKTASLVDALGDTTIAFTTEDANVDVEEIRVNGHLLKKKADDATGPHYEVEEKNIKIKMEKMAPELFGHYQAVFKLSSGDTITKNIMEVTMHESTKRRRLKG